MRDRGTPTIIVRVVPAKDDAEIERNRRMFEQGLSMVAERVTGRPTTITIDTERLPEDFGRPVRIRGDVREYLD